MEISQDTKRKIAEGLETFVGDAGFFIWHFLGSGSVRCGRNGKKYLQGKLEEFYHRYGIPYTPRPYLRSKR